MIFSPLHPSDIADHFLRAENDQLIDWGDGNADAPSFEETCAEIKTCTDPSEKLSYRQIIDRLQTHWATILEDREKIVRQLIREESGLSAMWVLFLLASPAKNRLLDVHDRMIAKVKWEKNRIEEGLHEIVQAICRDVPSQICRWETIEYDAVNCVDDMAAWEQIDQIWQPPPQIDWGEPVPVEDGCLKHQDRIKRSILALIRRHLTASHPASRCDSKSASIRWIRENVPLGVVHDLSRADQQPALFLRWLCLLPSHKVPCEERLGDFLDAVSTSVLWEELRHWKEAPLSLLCYTWSRALLVRDFEISCALAEHVGDSWWTLNRLLVVDHPDLNDPSGIKFQPLAEHLKGLWLRRWREKGDPVVEMLFRSFCLKLGDPWDSTGRPTRNFLRSYVDTLLVKTYSDHYLGFVCDTFRRAATHQIYSHPETLPEVAVQMADFCNVVANADFKQNFPQSVVYGYGVACAFLVALFVAHSPFYRPQNFAILASIDLTSLFDNNLLDFVLIRCGKELMDALASQELQHFLRANAQMDVWVAELLRRAIDKNDFSLEQLGHWVVLLYDRSEQSFPSFASIILDALGEKAVSSKKSWTLLFDRFDKGIELAASQCCMYWMKHREKSSLRQGWRWWLAQTGTFLEEVAAFGGMLSSSGGFKDVFELVMDVHSLSFEIASSSHGAPLTSCLSLLRLLGKQPGRFLEALLMMYEIALDQLKDFTQRNWVQDPPTSAESNFWKALVEDLIKSVWEPTSCNSVVFDKQTECWEYCQKLPALFPRRWLAILEPLVSSSSVPDWEVQQKNWKHRGYPPYKKIFNFFENFVPLASGRVAHLLLCCYRSNKSELFWEFFESYLDRLFSDKNHPHVQILCAVAFCRVLFFCSAAKNQYARMYHSTSDRPSLQKSLEGIRQRFAGLDESWGDTSRKDYVATKFAHLFLRYLLVELPPNKASSEKMLDEGKFVETVEPFFNACEAFEIIWASDKSRMPPSLCYCVIDYLLLCFEDALRLYSDQRARLAQTLSLFVARCIRCFPAHQECVCEEIVGQRLAVHLKDWEQGKLITSEDRLAVLKHLQNTIEPLHRGGSD